MFTVIYSVRTEKQIPLYIHSPLKLIPNKKTKHKNMKFFISVNRRKVSHDLPLDVFIIFRAIHLRKKKTMFLRYILGSGDDAF